MIAWMIYCVLVGVLLAGAALVAIAWLAPRRAWIAKLVRPTAIAVTFVGSSIFLIFALEAFLFLRFKDVQIGSASSPSGYTFYRNYHTNSEGFRDSERTLEKPPGTFRIMVVGDSVTFGSGVRNVEDVYPQRLQSILDRAMPSVDIEVINAALKGWSTQQQLDFLTEKGWAYSPDVLVLGYYLNDPETPETKEAVSRAAENALILPYPYGKYLYATSFTFYIATQRLNTLLPSIFGYRFPWKDHDYIEHIHNAENLVDHRRILERLMDGAAQHKTPMVVLLFPHMFAVRNDPYPYQRMHEHVRETAESKGVTVIDLLEPLRASSIEDFTVSQFDGHPNEAVHEVAAEKLFATLEELHLLPSPQNRVR